MIHISYILYLVKSTSRDEATSNSEEISPVALSIVDWLEASVSQSVGQSVSQSVSQSISQSVSQSVSHLKFC